MIEITIDKPAKTHSEKYRKMSPNYAKKSDVGSPFGASCLNLSRSSAFVLILVFRNLQGVPPWTDFGLPCGTLGPILLTCWKNLTAALLQTSKIPEQQIAPTTLPKKQARTRKTFTDNQSKQIMFYVCWLTKPRKPEVPCLKTKRSAELPKG